jgi:hypothetical protein
MTGLQPGNIIDRLHGLSSKLRSAHGLTDERDAQTTDGAASLINEAIEALEDILDDMRDGGLCVCQQVKDEATATLTKLKSEI